MQNGLGGEDDGGQEPAMLSCCCNRCCLCCFRLFLFGLFFRLDLSGLPWVGSFTILEDGCKQNPLWQHITYVSLHSAEYFCALGIFQFSSSLLQAVLELVGGAFSSLPRGVMERVEVATTS